jgi:hypothetical protein
LRLIGALVDARTLANERHDSVEPVTSTRIKSHAKSYIVELTDGTRWRIWPGDLAATLAWIPETEIEVLPIKDEFCCHALVNLGEGTKVRAIEAHNDWPVEELRRSLRRG